MVLGDLFRARAICRHTAALPHTEVKQRSRSEATSKATMRQCAELLLGAGDGGEGAHGGASRAPRRPLRRDGAARERMARGFRTQTLSLREFQTE